METSKHSITLNQQHEVIANMLSEIETLQEELSIINSNLLKATENTCSEYGDRILENMQSKLFYLQRVLRDNTETLTKHKKTLKEAINGSLSKSKKEYLDYYDYCQKTATSIRLKITKFKAETKKTISNNC